MVKKHPLVPSNHRGSVIRYIIKEAHQGKYGLLDTSFISRMSTGIQQGQFAEPLIRTHWFKVYKKFHTTE